MSAQQQILVVGYGAKSASSYYVTINPIKSSQAILDFATELSKRPILVAGYWGKRYLDFVDNSEIRLYSDGSAEVFELRNKWKKEQKLVFDLESDSLRYVDCGFLFSLTKVERAFLSYALTSSDLESVFRNPPDIQACRTLADFVHEN